MQASDDILFDSLVDGELSPVERRELLASLDSRPDGWRRCALAFLEAQTWRQEMPRLVVEGTSPSCPSCAERAGESPRESVWSLNWYAIAASLLIAFGLGLALGDLPHSHKTGAPNSSNIAGTVPRKSATQSQPVAPSDTMTLWVRDETGSTRPLRVPLVDATAMDQHLGLEFQSGLPADIRHQLEQHGYQVDSKRRYAPFVLEGGQPFVVPVEDTKIVPVSNRVY